MLHSTVGRLGLSLGALIMSASTCAPPSCNPPASPYFFLDEDQPNSVGQCVTSAGNAFYFLPHVPQPGYYGLQYIGADGTPYVQDSATVYIPPENVGVDVTFIIPKGIPFQLIWRRTSILAWQVASRVQSKDPKTPCNFQ